MSDLPIADPNDEPPPRPRGRPTVIKDGSRPCADCKAIKPIDQFNIRTIGGHQYLMSVCLDCKTQRDWSYRMRRKLLDKARGA
jgi:RNase P subunit RPR2